jgi:thiamine biosynthesis protein ThiI
MKAVCLISGGIDSPVAAHALAARGAEVVLLHMDNRPYSDDTELDKVLDLRERLQLVLGEEMRLWVAPHAPAQDSFMQNCSRPFQCVLCKRTMLHVAKGVARRLGADAVATGESLGQVASQTLHNLKVEEHELHFPVLRPLIGLDKIEIEGMAKAIGTYEISIRSPSVCRAVPTRPMTMCRLEDLLEQQSRVEFPELVRSSAANAQEIRLRRTGSS